MGRTYDEIDQRLADFLLRQKVFFVATAPLAAGGFLNLSPKGLSGTFRVVDGATVAYLDLTGSGVETIAHLRENARIVLMFCSFDGPPRIVRLHGRGEVVLPNHPSFEKWVERFPGHAGTRCIVVVHLERVSDSCGYGVPLLDYRADRDQLTSWAENKGAEGLAIYRGEKNLRSIDGLPGLEPPG